MFSGTLDNFYCACAETAIILFLVQFFIPKFTISMFNSHLLFNYDSGGTSAKIYAFLSEKRLL